VALFYCHWEANRIVLTTCGKPIEIKGVEHATDREAWIDFNLEEAKALRATLDGAIKDYEYLEAGLAEMEKGGV